MRTLLEADLVDELRLMVFPTILGRGKRLFPDGIDRLKLRLAESSRSAQTASRSRSTRGPSRGARNVDQPTAEDALRELEPLIGEWSLEAHLQKAQNEPS